MILDENVKMIFTELFPLKSCKLKPFNDILAISCHFCINCLCMIAQAKLANKYIKSGAKNRDQLPRTQNVCFQV